MKKLIVVIAACVFTIVASGPAVAQGKPAKPLQLKDLPAAVQQTVTETLKGGTIKNISKETEDGVEQYEVETTLNGKARDFNIDSKGTLLVIEAVVTIDAVPAAAKAAILKAVGTGTLGTVETIEKPGQPPAFEAAYKDKAGKSHAVVVSADGKPVKG